MLDMDSCPLNSPHEAVVMDMLLSDDQYRGHERSSSTSGADGKPMKDIAEVSRATDLILPKGSARITPTVSCCCFCFVFFPNLLYCSSLIIFNS